MKRFWLFLLLSLVYLIRLNSVQVPDIADGVQVRLVGKLTRQPYLKGSQQIIFLNGFFIRTERFPGYFYGQQLEVIGKVKKRVLGPYKTEFSLYYPQIRVLAQSDGLVDRTNFVGSLLKVRGYLEDIISGVLPEPHASLMSGILLGVKREMSDKFFQNLRDTGTLHVIVASGYNISVVAGFLVTSLVRFVRRRQALILAFFGILAYTIMAGAEPPVVRAAIMGGLTYLAQFLGREKDAVVSLVFAGFLMLLISPLILFDIGFQLSFLATAGILFLYPRLSGRVFQIPLLGEELKVTLAAQIATWPILAFHFGRLSFLSPLINALVLPVIPLIMALGAGLISVGLLWQGLAQIIGWFSWVPLTYFIKVIEWTAQLPWLSMTIESLSGWWLAGYYGVISLWLLRKPKQSSLV